MSPYGTHSIKGLISVLVFGLAAVIVAACIGGCTAPATAPAPSGYTYHVAKNQAPALPVVEER